MAVALAAEALPAGNGTLIFDVTPDLEIFAYVFAISLVAGILFGLAPAMESSRSALSSAVRGSTSSVRSRGIQDFLIAAQVALSLVLMIAGSMLIRSSIHSLKMDTGYDSKHVIDLDLQFPEASKYTAVRKLALVRELRSAPRRACPEWLQSPAPGRRTTTAFEQPPSRSMEKNPRPKMCSRSSTTPTFRQTTSRLSAFLCFWAAAFNRRLANLSTPSFSANRPPNNSGPARTPSAAASVWAPRTNGSTIGSELFADGPAYQVIGVARDTRGVEFDGSDSKQVYLPLPEERLPGHPILIRTQSDPAQVIRAIDPVISSIDPDLVATSSTLEEMLRQTAPFIGSSLAAAVASTVGLFGLLLALMGIYGTVSYIVVLRTREVGIRMAIGAQKRDILGLILRESTRPVLAGLLVGMFLAVGASYLLRGCSMESIPSMASLSPAFRFCFWRLHCLPLTRRRGEPCAWIPWWRSDTNSPLSFERENHPGVERSRYCCFPNGSVPCFLLETQ